MDCCVSTSVSAFAILPFFFLFVFCSHHTNQNEPKNQINIGQKSDCQQCPAPGELPRTTRVGELDGQTAYANREANSRAIKHTHADFEIPSQNQSMLLQWLLTNWWFDAPTAWKGRNEAGKQPDPTFPVSVPVCTNIVWSVCVVQWCWVSLSGFRREIISQHKRTGDTRGSNCTTPFPVYLRHTISHSCTMHDGTPSCAPLWLLTEENLLPYESRLSWILIATARTRAVRRIRARAKCSTKIPLWMVCPSLCGFCLFGRSVILQPES